MHRHQARQQLRQRHMAFPTGVGPTPPFCPDEEDAPASSAAAATTACSRCRFGPLSFLLSARAFSRTMRSRQSMPSLHPRGITSRGAGCQIVDRYGKCFRTNKEVTMLYRNSQVRSGGALV